MADCKMPKIVITTGDPNGIGAEITIKALNKLDLPQNRIALISNKKFVSTILSASRITTASNSSRPKWSMAKFRAFAFELFS